MSNRSPPALPAYALYGETERAVLADPLHCESIAARSRLHDWEIRPHRHATLFQLLLLRRGRLEARFDEADPVSQAGPVLATVPALAAHGFRFSPDVDGWVFTVDERHLQRLLHGAPTLRAVLERPRAWAPAPARRRAVFEAADALRAELQSAGAWRAAAIDAALLSLAVAVGRAGPADDAADRRAPPRALAHLQRYRERVEAEFRRQPSLAALAADLGITTTQLNRVCQRVLGRPALAVLHDRLALEAQRELAYTSMSVKQVALGLGFADAAYFTRFFRRATGLSPTAWRAARQITGNSAA